MYTKTLAALAAFLVATSASPIARPQEIDQGIDPTAGDAKVQEKSSGGKRGVCYTDPSVLGPFASSASWAYHWTSVSGGELPEGMEFIPTAHPDEIGEMGQGRFVNNAKEAISSGTKHLLFLNEPDKEKAVGGTETPFDVAAALYSGPDFQGAFGDNSDVKLGGPGISAGGMDWLTNFAGACQGCHFDFIPLHFYDYTEGHVDAQSQFVSFQGFLQTNVPLIQEMFKKADGTPADIWITEFSFVQIVVDENNNRVSKRPLDAEFVPMETEYMDMALKWLDGDSDEISKAIKRYAYFMSAPKQLIEEQGGALTEAGQKYASS